MKLTGFICMNVLTLRGVWSFCSSHPHRHHGCCHHSHLGLHEASSFIISKALKLLTPKIATPINTEIISSVNTALSCIFTDPISKWNPRCSLAQRCIYTDLPRYNLQNRKYVANKVWNYLFYFYYKTKSVFRITLTKFGKQVPVSVGLNITRSRVNSVFKPKVSQKNPFSILVTILSVRDRRMSWKFWTCISIWCWWLAHTILPSK
jgi:hypothetical protein